MFNLALPADVVFALLLVQWVGLKYLLAASQSWHLGVDITTRGRKIALVAGATFIWAPYVLAWVFLGAGPLKIIQGINDLWFMSGIGAYAIVTKLAAAGGLWAFLSPIQMAYAVCQIRRRSREQRESYDPSIITPS